MKIARIPGLRPGLLLGATLALFACGGGGGSGGGGGEGDPPPAPPAPPVDPAPPVAPLSEAEAVRFLSQATFGPSESAVDDLVDRGLEDWFTDQLEQPATLHLESVLAEFPDGGEFLDENGQPIEGLIFLPGNSLWAAMIEGPDQLRQRMAFALSQILVVSANSNVAFAPQALAQYADVLTEGAFGNYRDLLEAVTYTPAMSVYLTYLRNQKADPLTGRVPDENYARELLQLFTIGLVELNADGTPVGDGQGGQVELFDNEDITELAKVFTGLSFAGSAFNTPLRFLPVDSFHIPLDTFDAFHSTESKQFLDTAIPAGTLTEDSIDMALDAIFGHPNVGPFIGRQLIQRFVTSAPEPAYVQRVGAAFDAGSYTLPSGEVVGSGNRGDLSAVIAAILFDDEARGPDARERESFGKLREPVLRFTHWARAFDINSADASNEVILRNTSGAESLGQHPYLSPSVFNFYRPGYIAPGTSTGEAGLTAPELQITNATSIVGYANFITAYALELTPKVSPGQPATFVPDYSDEIAVAQDANALVQHLDDKLAHGSLHTVTKERIADITDSIDGSSDAGRLLRAQVASVLVMTSPEYIVLR